MDYVIALQVFQAQTQNVKIALNRHNDAQNPDVTQRLSELDVISVSIWLQAIAVP